MDIVKRTVGALNGSLSIATRPGLGTTFTMEFPIAIFTTQVMFVSDGGTAYALPSSLIRQIVRLDTRSVRQKHDYATVVHDDEIYTVARLGQVLGGEGRLPESGPMFLILPKIGDRRIGILVDDILHENEVIIKELGPFLGKRRFVFGVVIGERGELLTVLDLHDLASSAAFSRRIQAAGPTALAARMRRRVLVVDDSLLVREMEKNVLEMAGYEVVTAINGLDGYNKAISGRFDLILADIEMPEMDGFELIENVRKIRDYAEVPMIVLSTRDREQDKIRGIQVGASAWLQKQNFDDREFLRVVRSFIG
jgi:two-component system chemotaxis sensor kinase CheA